MLKLAAQMTWFSGVTDLCDQHNFNKNVIALYTTSWTSSIQNFIANLQQDPIIFLQPMCFNLWIKHETSNYQSFYDRNQWNMAENNANTVQSSKPNLSFGQEFSSHDVVGHLAEMRWTKTS